MNRESTRIVAEVAIPWTRSVPDRPAACARANPAMASVAAALIATEPVIPCGARKYAAAADPVAAIGAVNPKTSETHPPRNPTSGP